MREGERGRRRENQDEEECKIRKKCREEERGGSRRTEDGEGRRDEGGGMREE
jgi:hypothetical protein